MKNMKMRLILGNTVATRANSPRSRALQMKTRISPKSAKPSDFGAEGSAAGPPDLPHLPFLEF